MQTHFLARSIKEASKRVGDVKAVFAAQPSGKAILFIHGFNGEATKTWSDFHIMLPECKKCAGRDLFFYGYDGLRMELNASAFFFREFLNMLFGAPAQLINKSLPKSATKRNVNFAFNEVIITAHSLGAVVARRALLDATLENESWASNTKLVLFAPAHTGASVVDLALEAMTSFSWLRLFGVGATFVSPLINQLKKGSLELAQLLSDTNTICAGGANPHLVATRVIIAPYDQIVSNARFGQDPPAKAIANTTHTRVCKPRSDFLPPLTLLEECL